MVFFEFWSGFHFLSLHPNFLLFLGLEHVFEIYPGMYFFFKIICRVGDISVARTKTKLGQLEFFLFLTFFFKLNFFFCLLPHVSKHSMF